MKKSTNSVMDGVCQMILLLTSGTNRESQCYSIWFDRVQLSEGTCSCDLLFLAFLQILPYADAPNCILLRPPIQVWRFFLLAAPRWQKGGVKDESMAGFGWVSSHSCCMSKGNTCNDLVVIVSVGSQKLSISGGVA